MLSIDDEWASFVSQSQPTFAVSFTNVSSNTKSIVHKSSTTKKQERSIPVDGFPSKASLSKLAKTPSATQEQRGSVEVQGIPSKVIDNDGFTDHVNAPLFVKSHPSSFGLSAGNQTAIEEHSYDLGEEDEPEGDAVEAVDKLPHTNASVRSYVTNELFISTKTKVLFLNQTIDINEVFWKIPVEEYWKPVECVVKKQMKIVSKSPEEYELFMEKLKSVPYYTENIIKQINNPTARRIKFKDERKITVGISKKDIMNCRGKVKNAFYNCFAIIIRFKYEGEFREIHVKIFNTGKLEIPGVLNAEILEMMRRYVLKVLQPHISTPLAFIENSNDDNVLINSNFNCGFYIDREKLFSILRSNKYGLETAYDPCIYPGIKCKYYFNNTVGPDPALQTGRINAEDRTMKMSELGNNKTYTEVSFMIFRTGSCLIVGNCSETILQFIFQFIKHILIVERPVVAVANEDSAPKMKHPKLRKKSVNVSANYLSALAK